MALVNSGRLYFHSSISKFNNIGEDKVPIFIPILNISQIRGSDEDVRNSMFNLSPIENLLLVIGLILGTFGLLYQEYILPEKWKLFMYLLLASLTFAVLGSIDIWVNSEYLTPLLMLRTLFELKSSVLLIMSAYVFVSEIVNNIYEKPGNVTSDRPFGSSPTTIF